MRIALFITCLTDGFFPRAGIAAVRVLEHMGHEVGFPETQTCCGQPMFNNGFRKEACDLAERLVDVMADWPCVVTPSGSCAAMIREHFPELFPSGSTRAREAAALAGRTREFAELLVDDLQVDLRAMGARRAGAVAVHESCHARTIGAGDATRRLLTQIDGLEVKPLRGAEQCCGFGGTFAVRYSLISTRMVTDKTDALRDCDATTLVSTDAGCSMNIAGACRRRDVDLRVLSSAEIVAESLGLLEPEAGS